MTSVRWFRELGLADIAEAGGKNANLGGRKVGLCGQTPGDHPEFASFLASIGIDSISVTPDALAAVVKALA